MDSDTCSYKHTLAYLPSMNQLATIRAHPQTRQTRMDYRRGCFLYRNIPQRGLASTLTTVFPLPPHRKGECRGCVERSTTTYQRYLARVASRGKVGPLMQSRKRRRDDAIGISELIVIDGAAASSADQPAKLECFGGRSALSHGSYVDRDVTAFVRNKCTFRDMARSIDQCSLSLIVYLRSELGLELVATQVPMYSVRFRLATAIDLLCVDAATRSKLTVVEVKATRERGQWSSRCYTYARAPCSLPGLGSLDCSVYTQHQLQLWAMVRTLEREYHVTVDDAMVLRTNPDEVKHYPLNPRLRGIDGHASRLFARRSDSARD